MANWEDRPVYTKIFTCTDRGKNCCSAAPKCAKYKLEEHKKDSEVFIQPPQFLSLRYLMTFVVTTAMAVKEGLKYSVVCKVEHFVLNCQNRPKCSVSIQHCAQLA